MSTGQRTTKRTVTHWGAYKIETVDGAIDRIIPFANDPDPSMIGQSLVDVGRSRVNMPSIRESWLKRGPGAAPQLRGCDRFVEVDWETALDLAAAEIDRVRTSHGNEAIYGGSYGWASAGRFHHAQSQIHRFLNTIGGYTRSVNSYSLAAAEAIVPHVIGMDWKTLEHSHTSWSSIDEHTELIVAFGGIPLKNSQAQHGGVGRHKLGQWIEKWAAGGTEFVNVSPIADDVTSTVDPRWLPIRPGTDLAMMLAMIHTMVVEGIHDQTFLDRYCVGWDRLAAYVTGDADGVPKDADWAAAITSIDASEILSLARQLVEKRSMINVSWALQRAHHGEHVVWAAVALAAAVGQIGLPGGGFGVGYGASATIGNGVPKRWLPRFEVGSNGVDSFIPVARIADMLLHPGEEFSYDGGTYTYPDIKLVYWAGGNPFHHHQDLNRLRSAWQRPDTIIVNEPFWTATAQHADIVFPATTPLERTDIGGAPNDDHLFAMHRVIAPVGGARNDFEIFGAIATRLGVGSDFTEDRTADEWIPYLYEQIREHDHSVPSFDEFWRTGFIDRGTAENEAVTVLLGDFRDDPLAAPLGTPSGRIELYSAAIAGYHLPDCPPHPTWIAPDEWLGTGGEGPDLHLISNQPKTRLHSQWDHGVTSRNAKIHGHEVLRLHPDDARRREIADGDIVRVFNSRGMCLAGARITDRIRCGVVELPTGAWFAPDPELGDLCASGNPNTLTADIGASSLSQGPAAQTCLVRVERWLGPL